MEYAYIGLTPSAVENMVMKKPNEALRPTDISATDRAAALSAPAAVLVIFYQRAAGMLPILALLLLLAGCVVPQTFPKLTARGTIVDAVSGRPISNAQIVFTLGQPTGWFSPPEGPKIYGKQYTADTNGRFEITLSAEMKLRPLIDSFDQFPTMHVTAPGYKEGGVFPSYLEAKNPYEKELVVKLERL